MNRKILRPLLALALLLGLTACRQLNDTHDKPYPFNFQGLVTFELTGPKTVEPGGTADLRVTIDNTTKQSISGGDLMFGVLQAPDGDVPWESVNVQSYDPPVDFYKIGEHDQDDVLVGALQPGEAKEFNLTVRVPKKFPNSAIRLCFDASIVMRYITQDGISSWGDRTPEEKRVCSKIQR